jgi:hypothetical protein
VSTPFFDDDERSYRGRDEAQQRRARLTVVRSTIDNEETGIEGDETLALLHTFARTTDATNLLISELDNRPELRAFVDAVIGATGGSSEFEKVTDQDLAKRLGRSTRTVANYRNEFRAVDRHGLLIEIKDHWRDPDTLESHPHQYKCKLTALAVEAVRNAQLSPQWARGEEGKLKALEDAAADVALGATLGAPRQPKKRKTPTDAEVMAGKLRQAANAVGVASKLRGMVRNPNFEQLWELRESLHAALEEFDEVCGFETRVSTQEQYKKSGNAPVEVVLDSSDLSRRVEAVKVAQVENFSTQNGSAESTVYENQPDTAPPEPAYLRDAPEPSLPTSEGTENLPMLGRHGDLPGASLREAEQLWKSAFGNLEGGRNGS